MHIHRRCKTSEEPCIVYIVWKGETLGVCDKCWSRFPADLEWGDMSKPTMEEILFGKARFGENPIETEYKLRGKKLEEQKAEEDF